MSLRNYLDKIRPNFEEGGKLHAFKSVFDGFDTFLFRTKHPRAVSLFTMRLTRSVL